MAGSVPADLDDLVAASQICCRGGSDNHRRAHDVARGRDLRIPSVSATRVPDETHRPFLSYPEANLFGPMHPSSPARSAPLWVRGARGSRGVVSAPPPRVATLLLVVNIR